MLTDDQDLHMDSLSYMPYLKKHVTEQGTTFGKHYCTVAQCCPSRVTIWTGKAAHNTNVTDVNPPYGRCLRQFSFAFLGLTISTRTHAHTARKQLAEVLLNIA